MGKHTHVVKSTTSHHHVAHTDNTDTSGTIKIDFQAEVAKTLRSGVKKALAYQPKWAAYKPKGPQGFFPDAASYVASKKHPAPVKGQTVATAGKPKPAKNAAKSEDSGIIKVDLSKLLKPGVQKALAYHPKWTKHHAKAPTAFFIDSASYLASRKRLTPYKGQTTATVGKAKGHKAHHKDEPGLFLATTYLGHGNFTLGRRFDTRSPMQATELKQLRDGAKTFDQAMVPVRVTYEVNGKTKTEDIPLLFVTDIHLNLDEKPAKRA